MSLAWAILKENHDKIKAKTLFATHYHELNDMTDTFERIKNFNVSIKELKDKVIFLRKLVPGGSEHSFGIYVAQLAGMPTPVIHKAKKILKRLEKTHGNKEDIKDSLHKGAQEDMQLSFFQMDDPLLEEIKEEILNTNLDALTPIEALMKLNEIKRMLLGKR
jgi:DNA mismatch repair protein MutS